jgi:hypothetical protein
MKIKRGKSLPLSPFSPAEPPSLSRSLARRPPWAGSPPRPSRLPLAPCNPAPPTAQPRPAPHATRSVSGYTAAAAFLVGPTSPPTPQNRLSLSSTPHADPLSPPCSSPLSPPPRPPLGTAGRLRRPRPPRGEPHHPPLPRPPLLPRSRQPLVVAMERALPIAPCPRWPRRTRPIPAPPRGPAGPGHGARAAWRGAPDPLPPLLARPGGQGARPARYGSPAVHQCTAAPARPPSSRVACASTTVRPLAWRGPAMAFRPAWLVHGTSVRPCAR